MTEITRWTAVETAGRLRSGDVSVTEVTQAHLARLDAVNPALNAVTLRLDTALELARDMDAVGMPAEAGPLWGVPVTTKINVDQKGLPNSNGLPALAEAIAADDSPVVANLKRGGAVILGRTSTPEFSMRWCTSNPLHGVTRNPWDPALTPGGSSGAAAAAVAAGIGCIAHGNDLGGSLRYPAYCCGVASIRPSLGRVPAMNPTASANGTERPPFTQSMSVQGPIARDVADLRAALAVMAMRDSRDPLWTSAPDSGRIRGDRRLRLGHALNPWGSPIAPAVVRAMTRAVEAARAAGHEVIEIDPPHAAETFEVWGRLLVTENEILSRQAIYAMGSAPFQRVAEKMSARFDGGLDVAGVLAALQRRAVLQRAWALMFDGIDALILPTSLIPPFENDLDFTEPERFPAILEAQAPLCTVNVLGLPAVAIPTHLEGTVPLGVQIVAAMHDDALALDIAETLERELGTLWQFLPDHGAA